MNIFTKESAKKCIEIMGEERLNVVFNIKKP